MTKASTIIAVVSDTHIGSTTALAPPKFTIHNGRDHGNETQIVEHNRYQHWLYECWKDYWRHVYELAGIRGRTRRNRLIVIHLGDIVDGLHHNTVQVMNEVQDQIEAAAGMLKQVRDLADDMYVTYGTGAHNGGTAEAESGIAHEIGAKHAWDWMLDIDGVIFDLMHHTTAGRTDWTSGAAKLAATAQLDCISVGLPIPHYSLRGHVHTVDDSGAKVPGTRAVILPSWQLRTAHGKQASPRRRSDVGGFILDTASRDNPDLSRLRYKAPGNFVQVVKV